MKHLGKLFISCILFILLIGTVAWADCTVSYLGGSTVEGPDTTFGQTFTADCAGDLQSITIQTSGTGAASVNLSIYNGESVDAGDLLASQTGINLTSPGSHTITLSTPVPVVAGNRYTFIFQTSGSFSVICYVGGADPYPGGYMYLYFMGDYGLQAMYDMNFSVDIGTTAEGIAAPALSEWGVIIMSILLAGVMLLQYRKNSAS